ncbi:hypothetical protein [Dactylosporangium sp. NPDC006015]|uniref:hypothetical protein n=1 Tax=Dactylosporangium sp. NPDC006015 TaxID=3154576 RepID=UPI0033BAA46A
MNNPFDTALRGALEDLVDEAKPVDLAGPAVRRYQRLLWRRRALVGLAGVAAVGALAIPYAVLPDDTAAPITPGAVASSAPAQPTTQPASQPATPSAPPTPGPTPAFSAGPVDVGGGLVIVAAPVHNGTLVLNRSKGSYRTVQYGTVRPAPSGDLAAVVDGQSVGILNVGTGKVRWVTGPKIVSATPDWSPDGTQLVYATNGTEPDSIQMAVADVAAATARKVGPNIVCLEQCAPGWRSNGTELTQKLIDDGTAVYSVATGARVGDTVPGAVPGRRSWSPDGRFVVAAQGRQAAVIDLSTRQPVLTLQDDARTVYWTGADELAVARPDGVVLLGLDGAVRRITPLPADVVPDEATSLVLGRP